MDVRAARRRVSDAGPPVLVLRPVPEASETADTLRARGWRTVVSPLLAIEPVEGDAPGPQGRTLVLSSPRAVPFAPPGLAFVVGERTAVAFRERGGTVLATAPDGASLVPVIAEAARGPLLHLCGDEIAFDFAAALAPAVAVERLVVYRARPVPPTDEAREALARGDAVALLTSPRIARLLAREQPRPARVLALSPAVARAWGGSCEVAVEPTMDALMALLGEPARAGTGEPQP